MSEPLSSLPETPAAADRPAPAEQAVVERLRAAGCVFAEDEARLLVGAATSPEELAGMVERRASGLPLEHVLGWAEFCGRRVAVDPGVFVPRRRTEFLVREAVVIGRRVADRPVIVLDLCCGSGAVGAALADALERVELHAADLDPAAVRCARRNTEGAGGRVHQGDLFAPLPSGLRGRIDLLAANVPYVPSGSVDFLPPEAREHEALMALDGGPDGLDVLRRVTAHAARWLAPGGALLFEVSEQQAAAAVAVVAADGLEARVATCDELYATVVIGTGPS
jgi:release factor glutamine methyltransferase